MNPILIYAISGTVVLILLIIILNLLTFGFLGVYMRVKSSRGKKFLVKVRGKTKDYFTTGVEDSGFFIWKDSKKQSRRATFDRNAVYKMLGVSCIDTDDETNVVILHNWSVDSGFDAEKFDNLLVRTLMRPHLQDNKTLILIILVIIAIIVGLISIYFGYKNQQLTTLAIQVIQNSSRIVSSSGAI